MLSKLHTIHRRGLILSLIFFWFAFSLHAQDAPPDHLPDSGAVILEPVDQEDDDYGDDEVVVRDEEVTASVYWVPIGLQQGGGGPGQVNRRNLSDSSLKRYTDDQAFWYANFPFEKKRKEIEERDSKRPFFRSSLFQTLLWIVIIGGFATFIIIYLANSNVGIFRRKDSFIRRDEELEVETSNIFEINYAKEIEKAVSKGNFRFAIRLQFLQTLKLMSTKNIIQYKPDRTDFDYLLQTYSTKYYSDFFRLTRTYEYAWYGQFDVDAEKYRLINQDFQKFGNTLA